MAVANVSLYGEALKWFAQQLTFCWPKLSNMVTSECGGYWEM